MPYQPKTPSATVEGVWLNRNIVIKIDNEIKISKMSVQFWKTLHGEIEQVSVSLGLQPMELSDGEYLFCHPQFPNDKDKYIVIHTTDSRGECYDIYKYEREISYTSSFNQYRSVDGVMIHDIESIQEDAERCREISQKMTGNK